VFSDHRYETQLLKTAKKVTSNNSTTIRRNFLRIAGIIQLDVLYRPVTSIPVTYLRFRR